MIRDQESLKLSTNRETYINVFKIFFIYQLIRMFKKSNSPFNMYITLVTNWLSSKPTKILML